jgi:hypothetical protein
MTDRLPKSGDGEKRGHSFQLHLMTKGEEPVTLIPENLDAVGRRTVKLLYPATADSYDLRHNERITLTSTRDRVQLQLVVGSKRYVRNKQEQIFPDKVTLTSYPNPVRKSATFEYTLPEPDRVQLVIYDVLGRRVATLENGRREAGRHQVQFNSTDLSSGVYFGRLTTGKRTRTQKITIVR